MFKLQCEGFGYVAGNQILSVAALKNWLATKPVEWTYALAIRIALRALPYANRLGSEDALTLFRMGFVGWHDALGSRRFRYDLESISEPSVVRGYPSALNCMRAAIYTSTPVEQTNIAAVIHYAVRAADPELVWRGINADVTWLSPQVKIETTQVVSSLSQLPLHISNVKAIDQFYKQLTSFTGDLLKRDASWNVWIDWYTLRVDGSNSHFTDAYDDEASYRLANMSDTFWDRPPQTVNDAISSLIHEAQPYPLENVLGRYTHAKAEAIRSQLLAKAPVLANIHDGLLDTISGPANGRAAATDPYDLDQLLRAQLSLINMAVSDLDNGHNLPRDVSQTLSRYQQVIGNDHVVWYLADCLARVITRSEVQYREEWPGDTGHYISEILILHEKIRKYLELIPPSNVKSSVELPTEITDENSEKLATAIDEITKNPQAIEEMTENSAMFLGHMAKLARNSDAYRSDNIKNLLGFLISAQEKINALGEKHKGTLNIVGFILSALRLFGLIR